MMHRLYRLQHRLNLTHRESLALLTIGFFFATGLAARAWQSQPPVLPSDAYAEIDRLFAEGTAALEHEAPLPAAAPAPAPPSAILLDLNTASEAELEHLPRIGPTLAARITAYRAQRGGFRRVEDLTYVPGIGEKTLTRLRPHLTVSSPDGSTSRSGSDPRRDAPLDDGVSCCRR